MTIRWHILRDGDTLTLARHLPVRFDVCAETVLPRAGALRMAHQVRQDMWRALQKVRGFSPVVQVCVRDSAAHVRAGGRVAGTVPDGLSARIAQVLEDTDNRTRWIRHAGRA